MIQESRTSGVISDPEVPSKAKRRSFSTEYKLQIVAAAERCKGPGEVGALLRREGLYSSHLTTWRKLRDGGARRDLSSRKRGRTGRSESEKRVEELERENTRLRKKLEQAEKIISVQKKVSELLEAPDPPSDETN